MSTEAFSTAGHGWSPTNVQRPSVIETGIFNYSNEGEISWYEFTLAIKELLGSSCKVNPIPTSQYPTPAKRPHYSLLNKTKIKTAYGLVIPQWRESLGRCIERI
jgi:dTDP-4-dehydrorhamnose reductase